MFLDAESELACSRFVVGAERKFARRARDNRKNFHETLASRAKMLTMKNKSTLFRSLFPFSPHMRAREVQLEDRKGAIARSPNRGR